MVKRWHLLTLSLEHRWTRKADTWDWWKWSRSNRCQSLILFSFGQDVSKISTPKGIWGALVRWPGLWQKYRDRSELKASLWHKGCPGGTSGKEPACQCRRHKRQGFDPESGRRRAWQPSPIFLPGESRGQRSLNGWSSWGHKETDWSDSTHTHTLWHKQREAWWQQSLERRPQIPQWKWVDSLTFVCSGHSWWWWWFSYSTFSEEVIQNFVQSPQIEDWFPGLTGYPNITHFLIKPKL